MILNRDIFCISVTNVLGLLQTNKLCFGFNRNTKALKNNFIFLLLLKLYFYEFNIRFTNKTISKTFTIESSFKSASCIYSAFETIIFTIITTSKTLIISSPLISPTTVLSINETFTGITMFG